VAPGKAGARGGRTGRGRRRGCALAFLLLVLVAAGLAWSVWSPRRPYKGYTGPERLVTIPPGMGAGQALDHLAREGVIVDGKVARLYLILDGRPKLQAGQYLFRGALTLQQVLRMLVRGQTVSRYLTIIEGLTLEEIADQMARQKLGRRQAFLDAMRSPALIADFDPQAPDLEGYLFPETYSFATGTPERQIVATLVRTFRQRFERDVRPLLARGPSSGWSVRQVVILASIVEKEAKMADERPLIAAVYRNRVDRRIGLAADPTVIYALKRLGRWSGNLHREDLRMDSPYNTYRYAGLPPGPICSPGLASLVAAAAPADVPYLYFVSRNDGTHVFARTLAEHNRNVEIWQRKYWRDRWAAERREHQGPPAGGR
jgi:UPF0755 protein